MSKNKKNIAEQALLDMEKFQSELKESSKDVISSILSEGVKKAICEKINEDEDEDEKDYEVLDAETDSDNNDNEEDGAEENDSQSAFAEEPENDSETEPEEGSDDEEEDSDSDDEGDEDEWSEFEDYKVGDNEYDFTGEEDDEKVVKVYKLLKDTDNVVVKKDGEKVKIQDNETGAEYVIDLEDESDSEDASEPVEEGCIKEEEIAGIPDEQPDDEIEDPSEDYDFGDEDEQDFLPKESKKSRKTMKENKETIFEIDLGYTDNYQDKDPIQGLSNSEPSKSGRSWHKGVPTGTEKPWAGDAKGQSDPYEKTVKEEEEPEVEAPVVEEAAEENIDEHINPANDRHMGTKKRVPNNPARKDIRKKKHVASTAQDGYVGTMGESIEKDLKKALKENKEVKEALLKMKSALQEALLVNVNLGQFVKLVTENTTSQEEKVNILNRFNNEAKTVEQSKALYESINRELNKDFQKTASLNESAMAINESKNNETEIYQSKEMINMIDLMKRVNNI